MPSALFKVVSDDVVGDHRYVRVEPVNPSTLAADLAPRVRARYIDDNAARARLTRAAEDLSLFEGSGVALTEADIEAALRDEHFAVLPAAWDGRRPKHFDVRRSEFAEIVAAEILTQVFGTAIPASRIAHKEIPDQQARGADVMGLEGSETAVVLVLCEVKGSESHTSPPEVVADMEVKLRTLVTDRRALTQELVWLREHSDDANSATCNAICAAYLLKRESFTFVLSPILIRRASTAGELDPGPFADDADSFGHPIRWVSVLIDASLFDIADEVYQLAQAAA